MDARRILTILATALFVSVCPAANAGFTLKVEPGAFTIEHALQEARLRRLHEGGDRVVIRLQPGTYRLSQPIIIRPEDSGTTLIADGDVKISGGVAIKGWRKQGKLWVADVPEWNGRPLEFRQMWVNGRKAIRARDVEDLEKMWRIRNIDKSKEVLYVPAAAVRKVLHATHVEMVLHEMWCIANLRIKNIEILGDSAAVTFHNPESHVHFMHPWPSPMVNTDGHNSAFYLTNAKELLDSPGEWYLDAKAQRLYYMPRQGEDMTKAEVEVPALETLVKVEGTPDRRVTDVTIQGMTFCHTTWMRPSIMGHAPLQAGMYMIEAYKIKPQISRPNGDHKLDNQGWVGRPAAAIAVDGARGVVITDCMVTHCASTAIDIHQYAADCMVANCDLIDIGGTGILAGTFGPEGHEAHLPYQPTDLSSLCTGLQILNNRIDDAANEDWGCLGIGAGYVRDIRIENNEIAHVSYTGISLGWGWNQQTCAMANNLVRGNYIHHYAQHMYDTAGIYTLGAQPHTFIEENVVEDICTPGYVHDPEHWFYLYTDEGSSYITLRNNWTPSEKYLKNANGPGNTWENNGPQVADSIKANAGLPIFRKTSK
ncbi:MAG: right-handed parallel beta-helix repeat-containing protein [Prevotella sp.]|nr:right-handed parallel beta-helix repeat-containing protein [Prevotella sp.]